MNLEITTYFDIKWDKGMEKYKSLFIGTECTQHRFHPKDLVLILLELRLHCMSDSMFVKIKQ